MPETGITSSIDRIMDGYVFYNRLLTSDNWRSRTLGEVAERKFKDLSKNISVGNISTHIRLMAEEEAKKEQALLARIFGEEIHFDLKDENFYYELTNLINLNMSLKGIFSRYKDRMLASGVGLVDISTLYATYFESALKKEWDSISRKIYNKIESSSSNKSFQLSAEEVLDIELERIHKDVIREMFSSPDFQYGDISGYVEVLDAYDKSVGKTRLLEEKIYKLYGIDKIKEYISNNENSLKQGVKSLLKHFPAFTKKETDSGSWGSFYATGGLSYEAFLEYIISVVGESDKLKGKNLKVTQTGPKQIRPDITFSLLIDSNLVQDWFENTANGSTRKAAIESTKVLSEKLKEFSDGFLVYVNAKTGVLNSGFMERGGFRGVSDMTLATYGETMSDKDIPNMTNPGVLVSAIGSTMRGALMQSPQDRANLRHLIAADIAYLLFDDVNVVGVTQDGGQSLHLFSINGVYIPLSLVLFKLYKAFEKVQQDSKALDALVKVRIDHTGNSKAILYPKDTTNMWPEKWQKQREIAQNNIKIGINFLSNIQEIISKLNPNVR